MHILSSMEVLLPWLRRRVIYHLLQLGDSSRRFMLHCARAACGITEGPLNISARICFTWPREQARNECDYICYGLKVNNRCALRNSVYAIQRMFLVWALANLYNNVILPDLTKILKSD